MSKVLVYQAGPLPIDVQTTWPGNESLLLGIGGAAPPRPRLRSGHSYGPGALGNVRAR